jgi:twitching motility protein PilU
MEAGGLEGMQTFDQELEKLIHAGTIDRELGLSFATNRTNLQLRLDTQSDGASKAEAIPLKPREGDSRRPGAFRGSARSGRSDIDDMIER